MQDEPDLTPANRELERALKSLPATAARLDPVAAAFTAGRRSAHAHVRIWQSAAAILLVTTMAPHLLPRSTPAPHFTAEQHDVTLVAARLPRVAQSPQSLLMLQRSVQDRGIDALPASQIPTVGLTPPSNAL